MENVKASRKQFEIPLNYILLFLIFLPRFLETLSEINVENLNLKGNEICSLTDYKEKVRKLYLIHKLKNPYPK